MSQEALIVRVQREGQLYRKLLLVRAVRSAGLVELPASPNDKGRLVAAGDWLVMNDGGDHLWGMSDALFGQTYRLAGSPENEQDRLLLIEQAADRFVKARAAFQEAHRRELEKAPFTDQEDWFVRMNPYGMAQDEAFKDLVAALASGRAEGETR